MKNCFYYYQTAWNHQTCAAFINGTCQKEHFVAQTSADFFAIPTPPEMFKIWRDNCEKLKALGFVPETPATKASAKGQPKGGTGKGKGADAAGKG